MNGRFTIQHSPALCEKWGYSSPWKSCDLANCLDRRIDVNKGLVLLQHSLEWLHNSAWWVIITTIIIGIIAVITTIVIIYYFLHYSILLFVFSQKWLVVSSVHPQEGWWAIGSLGVAQGFLSLTFDSQAYIPFQQQHEMIAVFIISHRFSVNSCQPQIDE